MTRAGALFVAALAAAVVAACGGGGDDGGNGQADAVSAVDAEPAAATTESITGQSEGETQAELAALVRRFFGALVTGDDGVVWDSISTRLQGEVARSDVAESVALVAATYRAPGFQFNGFRSLEVEGTRAVFQVDAFITEDGERVGAGVDTSEAPPLVAVWEGGRWRLEPDVELLELNQVRVNVGS